MQFISHLSTDNGNKSPGYIVKQKIRSCRIMYVVYCPLQIKGQYTHTHTHTPSTVLRNILRNNHSRGRHGLQYKTHWASYSWIYGSLFFFFYFVSLTSHNNPNRRTVFPFFTWEVLWELVDSFAHDFTHILSSTIPSLSTWL